MSRHPTSVQGPVWDYVLSHVREHELLSRLRNETANHPQARMQISADQGRFLQWLVSTLGARRCLEVGTFTGYSSLAVALVLPPDGRVICCDVSEAYTAIARRYWAEAGVADRMELRLAPALDTLDALLAAGAAGTFDFAFIDADKVNYDGYYERCLKLVRAGGVIAFDNVLWGGKVADAAVDDEDTVALRALNDKLYADGRVDVSMLTVADGLTLVRRL